MQPKKIGDTIHFRPSASVLEDGRARLRTGMIVWIHPRGYFVVVQYNVAGILGQGGTTLQESIYLPENDSREQLTDAERFCGEYKTWHERKTDKVRSQGLQEGALGHKRTEKKRRIQTIEKFSQDGTVLATYRSAREAAADSGMKPNQVLWQCHGRVRKPFLHGVSFRFAGGNAG